MFSAPQFTPSQCLRLSFSAIPPQSHSSPPAHSSQGVAYVNGGAVRVLRVAARRHSTNASGPARLPLVPLPDPAPPGPHPDPTDTLEHAPLCHPRGDFGRSRNLGRSCLRIVGLRIASGRPCDEWEAKLAARAPILRAAVAPLAAVDLFSWGSDPATFFSRGGRGHPGSLWVAASAHARLATDGRCA